MPTNRLTPLVSLACLIMTTACAASRPASVTPPRLAIPVQATTPCLLDRLAERPTLADLEAAYMARGAALVACDAARHLAVQTLIAERALQDGLGQ